jgi:polysaccharide deacetylase family protein (PEP-CTERM system associated)
MINALSIDLEHWWCNEFLTDYIPINKEYQIVESLSPLLKLLDKYHTKATFFVLGEIAEDYPELVDRIFENGHEIACHAYSHRTLYELGKEGFDEEIKKSVRILRKYKPIGFRAPSFSVNNTTAWVFDILEKHKFEYDSSIFPIKTEIYGVPNAPLKIYRPSKMDVAKIDIEGKIVEFPLTVLRYAGLNIPIAGGFYLRALPLWFLLRAIRAVNRERPAIIYIHPWEVYSGTPRINAPFKSRFIANHGINSAFKKLENIVKEFSFKTVREVLDDV